MSDDDRLYWWIELNGYFVTMKCYTIFENDLLVIYDYECLSSIINRLSFFSFRCLFNIDLTVDSHNLHISLLSLILRFVPFSLHFYFHSRFFIRLSYNDNFHLFF